MGEQAPQDRILSLMSRKLRATYGFIRGRIADAGLPGLDTSHGDILHQLYAKGPLPMSELAARIGRDKSTVTALVAKLEGLGLLRRERDPADGRIVVVGLSAAGAAFEAEFRRISADTMKRLFRGFSAADKAALAALLERLGE